LVAMDGRRIDLLELNFVGRRSSEGGPADTDPDRRRR
jgi:hypothetical protein